MSRITLSLSQIIKEKPNSLIGNWSAILGLNLAITLINLGCYFGISNLFATKAL